MKMQEAEFYRFRRIIRQIKSMEDEKEKNRRLAALKRDLEKMRDEALKEEKAKSIDKPCR